MPTGKILTAVVKPCGQDKVTTHLAVMLENDEKIVYCFIHGRRRFNAGERINYRGNLTEHLGVQISSYDILSQTGEVLYQDFNEDWVYPAD